MAHLFLLGIVYLSFISLGLPDGILGVAIAVAIALDLSINISFNPARSLITDVTPEGIARTRGYTWMQTVSGSFGVLAIGLLDGNSWTDMGLGWAYLVPGFLWGVGCIVVVTAGYLIAASFRKGRNAMHDERVAEMSGPRLMFQALVEVPFGTVLFEEIAFRAVLMLVQIAASGLVNLVSAAAFVALRSAVAALAPKLSKGR